MLSKKPLTEFERPSNSNNSLEGPCRGGSHFIETFLNRSLYKILPLAETAVLQLYLIWGDVFGNYCTEALRRISCLPMIELVFPIQILILF